jgi:adenine-specific DNA glycosylase
LEDTGHWRIYDRAIASICFQAPVATLEAYGKRVFSRLLDWICCHTTQAKKTMEQLATANNEKKAGDFNRRSGSRIDALSVERAEMRLCP